jgi:hypothetical protein
MPEPLSLYLSRIFISVGLFFSAQSVIFLLSFDTAAVSGIPWSNLQEAVRTFLSTRVNDDAEDLISIIAFGSEARTVCERMPLLDCLSRLDTLLQNKGGGTNFSAALRLARDVIRGPVSMGRLSCQALNSTEPKHSPVLLFMSDGQPDSSEMGLSEMQVLLAAPDPNLRLPSKGPLLNVVVFPLTESYPECITVLW